MKIGFINSNITSVSRNTSKGTEIFTYMLIKNLMRHKEGKRYGKVAFASGNSKLPIHTQSVTDYDLMSKESVFSGNYYKMELLLVSKALSMQNDFDLYHANIGNGELVLPFAPFIKKPIIITLHGHFMPPDVKAYFKLIRPPKNVYFIAISNSQRNAMPHLNYIKTIHHGIDEKRNFKFNADGGESIMWAGRAIPEKGVDVVLKVINASKKKGQLFMLTKIEFLDWLQNKILKRLHSINRSVTLTAEFNLSRLELIPKYQKSKLFLFPAHWEEPFGLVMIEAMACGTPVVAYSRGSIPEIIKDGVTGFIVNPSKDDIRGNFIIKKTGVEGLLEAVKRIYAMDKETYKQMRLQCRQHVEKNFTVDRMVQDYVDVYKEILKKDAKT